MVLLDCKALGGKLSLVNNHNFEGSGQISVALRPEKIMIQKDIPDDQSKNQVKGLFEDFGYFGNLSIYRVRTESDHIIQVSKQNRDRTEQSIKWEDEVYLSWENNNLMLLSE